MLAVELGVQVVFKLAQGQVRVAGDGHGSGAAPGGVRLDLMLEGVVVEVVYRCTESAPGRGGHVGSIVRTKAPFGNGLLFQLLAVFHSLAMQSTAKGSAAGRPGRG